MMATGILLGMLWLCAIKGKSRLYLLLPLCLFAGSVRMNIENHNIEMREALHLEQSFARVEGKVRAIEEKSQSYAVVLEPAEVLLKDSSCQLPRFLVYLKKDAPCVKELKAGNTLLVSGMPDVFSSIRNPGEFDSKLYYRSLGLDYSMYAEEVSITDKGINWYRESLRKLRSYCGAVLDRIAQAEDAGILKAAILGDKSSMDADIKDLYQKNGISHLLAISGLHVSILGMGLYHILRKCGLGFGSAGLLCAGLMAGYGILTGESPSIIRAIVMLLVQCMAQYLGRTYDLTSAACLAALLLLLQFPYRLFQGGVQLSFGAVLGIGALGRYLTVSMEAEKKAETALLCGLAVQIVTYPLTLYHFFQYPLYSILLNLLVIPFMAYVVYSGLLGIVGGSFSYFFGELSVGSAHYILAAYEKLCLWFKKLPCSFLILGRPAWWQIGAYVFAAAVSLWVLKRTASKKKKTMILSATVLCCFFLLFPLPVQGFRTDFLDVGQGDGIVLRTGKTVILVDGGSSSEKDLGKYCLEPFLKSQGIGTIDYAIVSHGDMDHISGLLYLLEEDTGIRIKNLLLPVLGKGDEAYNPLKKAALKKGSHIYELAAGDSISAGKLKLSCLYPGRQDTASDRNNQSSMILASYGQLTMLLTGDMDSGGEEKMLESARGVIPDRGIWVLKAGHHGSGTSTGQLLLDTLRPKFAILSYGEGNSYGHPHKEVIERLEKSKTTIYSTAVSGAVTLSTDGRRLWWTTCLPVDDAGDNLYNKMQERKRSK